MPLSDSSRPPSTDASVRLAPGKRANTSAGPVKSSWVTPGNRANTTGNGTEVMTGSSGAAQARRGGRVERSPLRDILESLMMSEMTLFVHFRT